MVTEAKYSPLEPLLTSMKAVGEMPSAVPAPENSAEAVAAADGGVFVGLRFNLTQMAKTMTERSKEWLIQAERRGGVVYLTKHHLTLGQLRTFSRTNNRYQSSCSEEHEEKDRFHAVVRSRFGPHSLYVGSPVSGVKPAESDQDPASVTVKMPVADAAVLADAKLAPDALVSPERFLLIKETTPRRRYYETWKLATWLQAFLAGIPMLRIGIVTDQNLVREDEVPLSELVDSTKIREKASVMLVFVAEVLQLLHRNATEEGETYFLYHASNEDKLQLFRQKQEFRQSGVATWF
mmetsp:Transcript_12684/g.50697  ORF Transcript_12684/g.50697 Transcript_12684/m.50697 type:complete len:293 (-) Transcript_12684:42-920(-)